MNFFLPLFPRHQQDTESSDSRNFLASRVRAKHQPKITTGECTSSSCASDQLKIPAVITKNWLYSTLHPNILCYFPRVVNGFPFFKQKKLSKPLTEQTLSERRLLSLGIIVENKKSQQKLYLETLQVMSWHFITRSMLLLLSTKPGTIRFFSQKSSLLLLWDKSK